MNDTQTQGLVALPEFYSPSFDRELKAMITTASGPFSYISGGIGYTYFEEPSLFRGRPIGKLLLAYDFTAR